MTKSLLTLASFVQQASLPPAVTACYSTEGLLLVRDDCVPQIPLGLSEIKENRVIGLIQPKSGEYDFSVPFGCEHALLGDGEYSSVAATRLRRIGDGNVTKRRIGDMLQGVPVTATNNLAADRLASPVSCTKLLAVGNKQYLAAGDLDGVVRTWDAQAECVACTSSLVLLTV